MVALRPLEGTAVTLMGSEVTMIEMVAEKMNRGGRFKGCLEAGFGTRWGLNMVWWWGER